MRAKTQVSEGPAASCSHLSSGHQPWKSALITNACFPIPSWNRNSEAPWTLGSLAGLVQIPDPTVRGYPGHLLPSSCHVLILFTTWRRMAHLGGGGEQGQGALYFAGVLHWGIFSPAPPAQGLYLLGDRMRHCLSKGSKARVPPCVPLAP